MGLKQHWPEASLPQPTDEQARHYRNFRRPDEGSELWRSFGGGNLETNEIRDRAQKAEEEGGKSIWARSILDREAPYLFKPIDGLPRMESIRLDSRTRRDATFDRYSEEIRIFPRGVLAIEQRWDFDGRQSDLTIEDYIVALRRARHDASRSAWTRIRDMLEILGRDGMLGDVAVKWSGITGNAETFIRQHLVRHTLIFLDSPPGPSAEPSKEMSFDDLESDVKACIADVLNLTQWFDIYAGDYPKAVFQDAVRNRKDEIYLTDNDCSVIILPSLWDPADTLRYYQLDLVLATQFELARLTHLRYLAYYLRTAPGADDALTLGDDDGGRESLAFVLDIQNAVLRSNYDHPAEALIQHGFTRRFLSQVGAQRGTRGSLEELESYIDKILRAIELRTGIELSERTTAWLAERCSLRSLWRFLRSASSSPASLPSRSRSLRATKPQPSVLAQARLRC
jgi:hypothetical protein